MPYIDGKRVTNEEWTARYGTIEQFHTGPRGENPASAPEIDAESGVPVSKKKDSKKGRSPRSEKQAKAAIADALGVKDDSPVLEDIDISGIAEAEDES